MTVGALVATGLAACGHSSGSAVLVEHGNSGQTTSAACGQRTNLEVAEVTARQPARVTAARLIGASPGLRAVDVLGYTGPPPHLTKIKTLGAAGPSGDHIVEGEDTGPDPEALAVRLPNGVSISRDSRRATVLFVTVTASCAPRVASGQAKASLVAHKAEVTVEAEGKTQTQTLSMDGDLCVSKSAPDNCP